MLMFINYFKLKAYIKSLGFNDFQAKQTIKNIRKMDKEIKKSFVIWFNERKLPEYEIENFSMSDLIEKVKMNEIKAFLFMDWLKKDPSTAKKALSKATDSIIMSDELKVKIEENSGKKSLNQEIEDESDINL